MKNYEEEITLAEGSGFPLNMFDRGLRSVGSLFSGKCGRSEMKTDVQERDTDFAIDIDLPGYKKDQIVLYLEDGALVVTAEKRIDREEKDSDGKLLRRERFTGELRRSFAVGDEIKADDIKARYEDGVLHLEVPKTPKKELPEAVRVRIED